MESITSILQTIKCYVQQEYFWDALMSILTFLAVLVALIQERIKNHFYRPKLKVEMHIDPPDCHLVRERDVYFLRLRILNMGTVSAKNVEVIIGNLKDGDGKTIDMPQDNLQWSSLEKGNITGPSYPEIKERMYWPFISPGTFQYCNLGFVKKPTREKPLAKFELHVYWPSPNSFHILKKGTYYFDITVGCENGKAVTKKLEMKIFKDVPTWSEKELEYLKEFEISIL